VAGDADFRLKAYPSVLEWIERIKKQPNYVPMDS
jgi:hypothetical protein